VYEFDVVHTGREVVVVVVVATVVVVVVVETQR
jgi:hypothetical protein